MIPLDIKTAATTLSHLRGQVSEHQEARAQVFVALLIISVGAAAAWGILPVTESKFWASGTPGLLAVAAGALTYAAILIGFVVNLMLFSGKIGRHADYKLEELAIVVERVRYLLYSQLVTMFSAIGLSAVSLITILALAVGVDALSAKILVSASAGFALICILRTAILPLQIYELHEASFISALSRNKKATGDRHKGGGVAHRSD